MKNGKLPTKVQLEKLIAEAEAKARKAKTKKTGERELLYSSKSKGIKYKTIHAKFVPSSKSKTSVSTSVSKSKPSNLKKQDK